MITTREGLLAIAVDRRRLQPIGTAVAAGLALLFGLFAWSQWQQWLLFRHAQPFGDVDPVLGKDLSFYVLQLPFLETLQGFLLALVVLGGLIAGAVYAALILGLVNKMLESWSGAVIAKIAVLVFIIFFIQRRPQGMFALKGRAVE